MDKLNELIRLWNSTSESIATTNKTIGPNSFHYLSSLITILRVPLPALHPSLPTRVIIRTSRFIRSATLHPHALVTLSPTSTSYTNNSDNTLPMLNVDTKLPLIPDDYRLRISRLEAKCMSRLNFSVQHDLPRNYPINSLVRMKSLHSLAPILSLSDFRTVSALYTQFSTSQCWNQQLRIQFLIEFNPHPCQSLSTMNRNSKSPKSSTPKLTTDIVPASYCILSDGQVMRALTKKLPGSSLLNSDMLPNSLWISTLPIQPSLVHCQAFDLGTFYFNIEVLLKFSHYYIKAKTLLFTILLPYSRIFHFLTTGF